MTHMHRSEIVAGLKELLGQQKQLNIDVDSLHEQARLSQIGFDSISILDFIYDIESRFNVRIEIADLVRMELVKDLIDYLESRVAA
jgi:acyl carrier protein